MLSGANDYMHCVFYNYFTVSSVVICKSQVCASERKHKCDPWHGLRNFRWASRCRNRKWCLRGKCVFNGCAPEWCCFGGPSAQHTVGLLAYLQGTWKAQVRKCAYAKCDLCRSGASMYSTFASHIMMYRRRGMHSEGCRPNILTHGAVTLLICWGTKLLSNGDKWP